MLLLLEKKHRQPEKVKNKTIYIGILIAVFIKVFFTGFEFFTTILSATFIPVVYYYWLEKKGIKEFFIFSFKVGLIIIVACLLELVILLNQMSFELGSFSAAINYILDTIERRSSFNEGEDMSILYIFRKIAEYYSQDDIFRWGFIKKGFPVYYIYVFVAIFVSGLVIYFRSRKVMNNKIYMALLLSCAVSVLCPVSWLVVFNEHAFYHPVYDHIIWFFPFLLYGYLIIGVCIKLLFNRVKDEEKLQL
jgi:hypothetical protein